MYRSKEHLQRLMELTGSRFVRYPATAIQAGSTNCGLPLDGQTPPAPCAAPTGEGNGHTIPRRIGPIAMLFRPLSKVERVRQPLFYFVRQKPGWLFRLLPPPREAPFARKMQFRFERAAIALLWPIANALSVFFLWRDGLSRPDVLALWRAVGANLNDPNPRHTRTTCSAPCALPAGAPSVSTPDHPDGSVPACCAVCPFRYGIANDFLLGVEGYAFQPETAELSRIVEDIYNKIDARSNGAEGF